MKILVAILDGHATAYSSRKAFIDDHRQGYEEMAETDDVNKPTDEEIFDMLSDSFEIFEDVEFTQEETK